MKKAISLFLSVLMVFSVVSVGMIAMPVEAQAQTPVSDETTTTVVACSDYQYMNSDTYSMGATGNAGGEVLVSRVAAQMQNAGISDVDGFICAGDFDYDLNRTESDTRAGVDSLANAATASGLIGSGTNTVYVQGNHDPTSTAGGTSPSGDNDPASGAYGVFVINERDYQWASTGVSETATLELSETMRRYFNHKIAVDYTAPIFVVSHLPLHFSMRTVNDGDNQYAKDIFDVLQDAGDHGLNIIFLFGHNHSNGWDDYLGGPNIFLKPGDSINIADKGSRTSYGTYELKFTYMNAGYMGYYKHQNTSTGSVSNPTYDIADMTMSCFQITDSSVTITRYNTAGTADLKKAGIWNYYKGENTNANIHYTPDASVVNSPYSLSLTSKVDDTEYEIDPVVHVEAEAGGTSDASAKVYPRITNASQLVSGGKYIFVYIGLQNASGTFTASQNKILGHTLKTSGGITGFDPNACLNVSELPVASISGDYEAYEFTLTESSGNWIMSNESGQVKWTKNGSNNSHNVSYVPSGGTAFTFNTANTDNAFKLTANVNGTTVMWDYDKGNDLINGWPNGGNQVVFAVFGAKNVSGTVISPYSDHTAASAVYPRITDPSQIVEGERYVMVFARTRSEDNKTGLISRESITANDRTGFRLDSVPAGFSLGSTIEGAFGAYEWIFTKSGNDGWKLGCDGGQLTLSKRGTTESYNGTLTDNGSVFTLVQYGDGLWYFHTTVGTVGLNLDYNKNGNLVNSYNNGDGPNNVVIALYGAKQEPDYQIPRYVKQNVTDTSSLTAGGTYVIVNGTNAVSASNDLRAIPVQVNTDENGGKYLDHGNNDSLEYTWQNNSFTATADSQQRKLQVTRTGAQYNTNTGTTAVYEQIGKGAITAGETYIIVPAWANNKYALALSGNDGVTSQQVTVDGNYVTTTGDYSAIEWKWTNNKLQASNNKYLNLWNDNAIKIRVNDNGSALTCENGSNPDFRFSCKDNNRTYYLRFNTSSNVFEWSTTSNDYAWFALYKKTTTTTTTTVLDPDSVLTYSAGLGSDAASYITLTDAANGGAKILLHNVDTTLNDEYTRHIGSPVSVAGMDYTYFTESDIGADFEFYRLDNVTMPGELKEVVPAAADDGANNSPIESVTISANEATLYVGASATTYTGLYFNVTYKSGEKKAADTEQIPIRVGDLIDYTGHNNVSSYCGEPGDVPGLGAFYSALDGYWFSDLILHLIQNEDYPEYPNEGSVKVDKTAGAPNFLTNGVAKVELTATGIPMTPGIDIVLMLDTSSSMTNTVGGISRLEALQNSVGAMLDYLAT
ncbi:MAG: VWA domain-containing protein, partial [Clostridia bacterium]|nr:VWA domain-containing protein [Clostridia bacterium]